MSIFEIFTTFIPTKTHPDGNYIEQYTIKCYYLVKLFVNYIEQTVTSSHTEQNDLFEIINSQRDKQIGNNEGEKSGFI